MKHLTCALTSLLAVLFVAVAPESKAIILYGKDNDANQTDPSNGAPWANVARLTNSSGSSVTRGSAVYLGHRYMLTANHVDPDNTGTHVTFENAATFDSAPTLAIEPGSHQQVAANVDLKIFRLSEDPGLPSMMLYEDSLATEDLSRSTVQVGWGRGRDPNVAVDTDTVAWGTDATIAKRWGTNTTLGTSTIVSYSASGVSYNYEALQTRLLNNAGPDEAAMTLYDSGGSLLQNIGGNWVLSGIATLAPSNEVHFGAGSGSPFNMGDTNSFVRISSYSTEINAIIPEPSTWAMAVGIGALGLAWGFRRLRIGAD